MLNQSFAWLLQEPATHQKLSLAQPMTKGTSIFARIVEAIFSISRLALSYIC